MIRLQRKSLVTLLMIPLLLGMFALPSTVRAVVVSPTGGITTGTTAVDPAPNAAQGAQTNIDTGNLNLFTTVGVPLCDSQTGKCSPSGIIQLGAESFAVMILGTGGQKGSQTTGSLYYPGAIGAAMSATGLALSNPPASSREYIADAVGNLRLPFTTPAYAQGIGFSSLSPLLTLWKVFRDIAYFFFVIIFVVIGFLIMIRSKIGSQTAVTVQQALPKLVVSLILVTFSYAIAGLLLDVMYLLIYLMIGIFSSYFSGSALQGVSASTFLTEMSFNKNFMENMWGLISNGVVGTVAGQITTIGLSVLNIEKGSNVIVQTIEGISNILITLILAVVVLVSIIRVFLALLQAYVGIFFSVITAPIQLMFGALPGQNTFGKWIRGLLENILVFPTLILLFFIAYLFTSQSSTARLTEGNPGFSAPQLGTNRTAGGFAAYQGLIALGVILAMPEVLKVTKGIMKGEAGISVADLTRNLKVGNQYAAPGVGVTAGLTYGAIAGGVQGFRTREQGAGFLGGARSVISGVISGAPRGETTMGGIRRTAPLGYQRGMGVARTIESATSGQMFASDNIGKKLEAIQKATGTKTDEKKAGETTKEAP